MNERDVARELLRELLAHHQNGDGAPVPQVPPPPVAAVHRPSSWQNGLGDGFPMETVTIASDADLDRFARRLADDTQLQAAVREGRIRLTLATARSGGSGAAAHGDVVRVERGAVTERTVAEAARAGARLLLGPRAVLTPLAREKARAAGVAIEREGTC